MVRLSLDQRRALGGTIRELANFGAAALVFGQFVGEGGISWSRPIVGTAIWLVFVTFALRLEGE